ncbi:sulfatase [Tsuneonella dongtanensis]|uniref:sulfatase family protein n=1 Tax=Tsuneonella dongtanensis TaxID=692370 RepID=UPI0009425128|nr:sulfatase [Tsuneonella dongtanensis]
MRRFWIVVLALALLSCTTVPAQPEPSRLPNVVMFIADDLSLRDAGPYGAKVVKTPTLDHMAREGLTFDQAYVASPACAPSRSALFTGLMPEKNGVTANHDFTRKPGVTSLMHDLVAKGYEVAIFGKVAHGITNPNEHWDHGVTYKGKPQLDFDELHQFLDKRDPKKPLFLLVGTRHPHVPWIREGYRLDPKDVDLPNKAVDTPQTRINRAQYYESVARMDEDLDKTLDLAATYLELQDTLVLFSSDHGAQWPFAKWNLYDESVRVPLLAVWPTRIAPGTRTSGMVSWIDIVPTVIDLAGAKMSGARDGRSFATVLFGKADEHRDVILTTHTGDGPMNVFPMRSARTDCFVYVRNLHPEFAYTTHIDKAGDKWTNEYWQTWLERAKTDPAAAEIVRLYRRRPAEELYDLQADPGQRTNLIADPRFTSELARLRAAVDRYSRESNDESEVAAKPTMPEELPDVDRAIAGVVGQAPLK